MYINNSIPKQNYYTNTRKQDVSFGKVFKTRFFELLPNGEKAQIQDDKMLKFLCGRLSAHLRHTDKENIEHFGWMSKVIAYFDKDFSNCNLIRKFLSNRHDKDHFWYLLTGSDAYDIDLFAHAYSGRDKKTAIIDRHWQTICDKTKRLKDAEGDEASLNVILEKRLNPKTSKECYYIIKDGLQFVKEKTMLFPYRRAGENII